MHKTIFAAVLTALTPATLYAKERTELTLGDPIKCATILKNINDQLDITIEDFPDNFRSPGPLIFSAAMTKNFALSEIDWDFFFSRIHLILDTTVPYPKKIEFNSSVSLEEYFFNADAAYHATFTYDIPVNIGAWFELQLIFDMWSIDSAQCVIRVNLDKLIEIKSDYPDLFPPLVRKISFDKSEYAPGDQATVKLHLSERLIHDSTDRLEFVNPDIPDSENPPRFPWPSTDNMYYGLHLLPDGDYTLTFTVPEGIIEGKYYLKWFNRLDANANFEDLVGRIDELERQVSLLSPLIVK